MDAACQSAMQEVLGELLYNGCLLWLDDVLLYADSVEELLSLMEKVFTKLDARGVKLSPTKCDMFCTEVEWCGRLISGDGVRQTEAGAY